MRNFDERIAEINRRSEEILKKRKQRRKQILTFCAPLVLVAAVLSVIYLPGQFSNKSGAPQVNESMQLYSRVQSVRVTGGTTDNTNTDPEEILEICGVLYGEPMAAPESNEAVSESNNDATLSPTDAPAETLYGVTSGSVQTYTISLVDAQGSDVSFSLSGDTLVDTATKRKVKLTQYQLDRLKDLLGISDEES